MSRRFTTSALTFLMAAGVAKTAQAATNHTITNSGSKTVSDSGSGWWSEDTKWGDFGAGYSAGYEVYSNYSGTSKHEKVEGSLSGQVFGESFSFVSLSAKAHAGQSSTLLSDFYLSTFGLTLVNVSDAQVDLGLADGEALEVGSLSYSSDGVTLEECVSAEAEADMSFVGVPIVASAEASGCLGLTISGEAKYNSTSKQSSIDFTGTPYGSLGLGVSAGVGTSVASAGAYGELTFLEVAVPITNTLSLTPASTASTNTSGYMQYTTSGRLTLTSLAGEIGLYVKLGFVKYTYTLFDWNGYTWYDKLLFTDSIPVASGTSLSLYGDTATGSYTFTDVNPETGSTYKWYRASSATGTGSTQITSATGKTRELSWDDSEKYLKFCVTPSNGDKTGEENCSDWTYAGLVASYYWDSSWNGDALTIAHQKSQSGTCFTLSDVEAYWNDDLSSYKFKAPSGCNATLYLYKDADCSGSVQTMSATSGGHSWSSYVGDSFNDEISSVKMVYCDSVTASNVTVGFDQDYAKGTYDLDSASLFDTESSTYVWYRADDANGTNAIGVSTGQDRLLYYLDNGKYLKFCVTPGNGTTTGTQVCSSWTRVTGVTFYWDGSYGGGHMVIPYGQSASGTCYTLSHARSSWNDNASSYKFAAPASSGATLTLYKDADCSGSTTTMYASAGSTVNVSSIGGTHGSGWNDSVSSFKVTY